MTRGPTTNDPEKLERLIGELLENQPSQPAPTGLEARVLAAITIRRSASRWQLGVQEWPRFAQVAFALAALAAMKLVQLATDRAPDLVALRRGTSLEISWLSSVTEALTVGLRTLPEHWLWGACAILASLYFATFVIGAVAYRALYVGHELS